MLNNAKGEQWKLLRTVMSPTFSTGKIRLVCAVIRVFHKLDEICNNANIGIRGFATWKQKILVTLCHLQWGFDLGLWLTSDFKAKTLLSELTRHFACKTDTLGYLYSYRLFHLNQVVHEQKFENPLSSTCQISSERRVLDMELEVNQRPGFNPHWG